MHNFAILGVTATVIGQASRGGESRFVLAVLAAFVLPALLAVTTAFARILIVLFFLRAGLGSNVIPPNTVVIGLAVLLTWLVMGQTVRAMSRDVLQPLYAGALKPDEALHRSENVLRSFMARHTDPTDFKIVASAIGAEQRIQAARFEVLATAFALSELRVAFVAGLLIYLPFLVIDVLVLLVVSAIGPGPFAPQTLALPVKVAFFVMADGWRLIFGAILRGYGG